MALATEHMVQAINDITVNQGIDPTKATFVAGGGAAGLNCVAIARRLGCKRVLVTEAGAALSASGALLSDLSARYQAMYHANSRSFDAAGVSRVLARLRHNCEAFASGPGAGAQSTRIDWSTEARYIDQAWEIEVPLPVEDFASDADFSTLVADFHAAHQDIFAVSDPNSDIELISWSAEVSCRIRTGEPGRLRANNQDYRLPGRRVHFVLDGWKYAEVFRLESIPPGISIAGPALVESDFTSIVIDPGAVAERDQLGNLIIKVVA
jgi:N-methylhydantoinase A